MSTFKEVQRAFPYLVSKQYASGGGDVGSLTGLFHAMTDVTLRRSLNSNGTSSKIACHSKSVILGFRSLHSQVSDRSDMSETFMSNLLWLVHHGRIFTPAPPVGDISISPFSLSPASTNASTPDVPGSPVHAATIPTESAIKHVRPYLCFGFVIQDAITYLSDVSHIPEDVWAMFETKPVVPPVFVLDCLRVPTHPSHLSVTEAMSVARRMKADKTYLLGFSHELSHDDYVAIGEAAGGKGLSKRGQELISQHSLQSVHEGQPIWIRPAFDGLRVSVTQDGQVRDAEYK